MLANGCRSCACVQPDPAFPPNTYTVHRSLSRRAPPDRLDWQSAEETQDRAKPVVPFPQKVFFVSSVVGNNPRFAVRRPGKRAVMRATRPPTPRQTSVHSHVLPLHIRDDEKDWASGSLAHRHGVALSFVKKLDGDADSFSQAAAHLFPRVILFDFFLSLLLSALSGNRRSTSPAMRRHSLRSDVCFPARSTIRDDTIGRQTEATTLWREAMSGALVFAGFGALMSSDEENSKTKKKHFYKKVPVPFF